MKKWPYQVQSLSPMMIQKAINDPDWQKFRLALKGLPTEEKLKQLELYMNSAVPSASEYYVRKVRVDNYINALRRGGQLNLNNEVQR